MSTKNETIYTLIARQQRAYGQATALLAAGRSALSYTQLHEQIHVTAQALHQMGIARHDRVALVLPNGPAMAVAFLAVASVATCAPLNPAYKPSEFEFYLKDLQTKALIVLQGRTSPAADVAHKLNLPVIELCPLPVAGSFQLISADPPAARSNVGQQPDFALPDDVALLLHTSGTTPRPKLVPLTHANLCASATNIQKTLHLTPNDRCLNIMPLFHIHGLVGALLASLQAGGSVICTPGFTAVRFFEWLVDFQPTWYTAVPTMHQAILAQAEQSPSLSLEHCLRLIRSSSSALPPTVLHQLEQHFQVPVIEAYGMTEAAHQMASNPLPPLPRKPGSIGLNMPLGTTTSAKSYVAPRTPFEERLTALWHDVLDVQISGIHDDFLSLGGDSLAAARIINQIFDCFQIELTLPAFFAASTIADLALLILQGKLAESMPTQVDELLAELQ